MKVLLISIGAMLLSICSPADSFAADDTCIEDGGAAHCVGPEVGPFRYQVANGTWLGQGDTEAAAIAAFTQDVIATGKACTVNLTNNLPPLQDPPLGGGSAQSGSYTDAIYYGIGQFWSMNWTLSTEVSQQRAPLRYEGTRWNYTAPPCQNTLGPGGAYVSRFRDVSCPGKGAYRYQPNTSTAPTNAYCYLAANTRNPAKNLGSSQCELLSNPVNGATGNKFQAEIDYVGAGAMPLRLSRYYNSQLWEGQYAPSGKQMYWSRFGYNWRSSFDAFIRFSDSIRFPTAYVYRPDGRTLFFKLRNGEFVADADIADRLIRLTDGSNNPTGWEYTVAQTDEVETYDESGKLVSIANRAGVTQTLAYDGSGRLSTVTDAFGRQLTFGYNASGQLANFTDPSGASYIYGYNSVGNVSSVTYPGGHSRTYVYNESANTGGANRPYALTGIVDENGVRFATYKYDSSERVISSEHAGGAQRYLFSYASNSTIVTDPLGTARTHTFTTLLGVARTTGISQPCVTCAGSAARSYDSAGNLASQTDFNGRITGYSYDLSRNLETSRTEALGTARARTVTTQWHSSYRVPTEIEEPGKRTTFTHDASGNVLTKTERDTVTSESRTWTYTYNSFGRMLTADGPRTDVSDEAAYTYYTCTTGYECGQVHTVTNAAGHVTTYNTYNAHGQPLTMTDPNGVVTTLAYDLRQRLTSRTVGSEVTTMEYWPTGLLKKATLPDGSYLEYTYDAAHRLTDINDADGNRIHYTLDLMGNRTGEHAYDPSNALMRTRTRAFNALNRLQREIGAAGTPNVTTTYGYDNNGNQTSIAAPLGRTTGRSFDELNRLTQVTDPLLGVTHYDYNALDQLISVTDPRGKVTSYTYNALGDLTQQVSPDTGTTTNLYDTAGNLLTSTDARGKTAIYHYDALNRVTSLTYPDQAISYTYDSGTNQKGRLTQVTDDSGSTSWTYDAQGRMLSRQQIMGITKSVGYGYDLSGRLQTLTLPSGNTIGYGYTDGKVTSITLNGSTTILSNVLYQPFGPTQGWTWGNGSFAIREYDSDGLITALDSVGLKSYDYDDAFRITDIVDAGNAARSQSYGYDLLDRLTSATGASLNQGWTYDANGNRLSQTGDQPSTYTISSTSNRLSSISGTLTRSYAHNASGSVTGDGTVTSMYDDAGRLVSATKAGVTTTYAVNAVGQRVRKTSAGTSIYFVYDESGHLVGEYDNAGALIQETVWLGDIPVATMRPSGASVDLFYVHADHLNTPRRISRPSDNVIVWRWDSDPFGTSAANQDPDGDTQVFVYGLRFPGQYADSEGLYYNYFRDYDPSTGRYAQSDPIGLRGGLNTYGYVNQNPVLRVDPSGLVEWEGSSTGGSFFTAGATYFKLRTKECVNGKRGFANVLFIGVGLSWGVEFSASMSDVTLNDSLWDVNPNIFDGDGVIANAGISIPRGGDFTGTLVNSMEGRPPQPNGFGCSAIRLGNAGGMGCGTLSGLEFGIGGLYGSSTVLSSGVEPCDCATGKSQ